MTDEQHLEKVKRPAQIRNWSFCPNFAVRTLVRAVLIMMHSIAKNVRLPLRRFHRDATRHHPSLTGRRSMSPALTTNPLPGAGQATPAAWHSLSLSGRSFPWAQRSAPSCGSDWASRIFDSWAVYILIWARVSAWISGRRLAPSQYWCGSCQLSTGATRSPPSGLVGGWPSFRLNCPCPSHFSARPWCIPQCNVLRVRWRWSLKASSPTKWPSCWA